jgi:hypothetical protein
MPKMMIYEGVDIVYDYPYGQMMRLHAFFIQTRICWSKQASQNSFNYCVSLCNTLYNNNNSNNNNNDNNNADLKSHFAAQNYHGHVEEFLRKLLSVWA